MIEVELGRCVAAWYPGTTGVANCARLSGGASQETWSFDIVHPDGTIGAILRLGTGFIMQRVEGETIPRKILRDEKFARARPMLARQLGETLAAIHGLALSQLPELRRMTAAKEIAELERDYRRFDWPRPVFELALRWLRDHDPGSPKDVTLVHGDFRHGNLIIGPDGLRAVLDWELAHIGDPMEDLGWICVNSWRFGEIDKPVGGLGSREELFAGYRKAGRRVDPARVMFWEVMGTLRWGVMCCGMMQRFRSGPEHSVERAMIGRRASETEIDLLRLLAPRA
jgi:aminoglycoside phosphotransferase (APT) family kinase protein